MPGFLLHRNAVVTCSHMGQATPAAVIPNVKVMQQPIVVLPIPWLVAGCSLPPPPAANGPCVTAMFTTSAQRVSSYNLPVLLLDSQAICAPSGTPLLITVTQTVVTGI
jgi:hypothetical protein